MGKIWGARGLGSVRACAQDVNWEESRILACTAHRTAGFLSFKVVYVTWNPGMISVTNVPSRTLMKFIFISNPFSSPVRMAVTNDKLNQSHQRTIFFYFYPSQQSWFLGSAQTSSLFDVFLGKNLRNPATENPEGFMHANMTLGFWNWKKELVLISCPCLVLEWMETLAGGSYAFWSSF